MLYKAFISYSHSADAALAPSLQAALERFASPGIACEDVGDFRSKASAEAWIRDFLRSCVGSDVSDSGAYSANAKTDEDAI